MPHEGQDLRLCWLILKHCTILTWEQLYRLGSLVTHSLQDSIDRYVNIAFNQDESINGGETPERECSK